MSDKTNPPVALDQSALDAVVGGTGGNETISIVGNHTEATGLSTGKRRHEPFSVSKPVDK